MRPASAQRELRFRRLFDENRADLLAYALRRARSSEDAADVLSETFLIAWRTLDSLPPGDEARLWLFGVARNLLRRGVVREAAIDAVVERLACELGRAAPTVPLGGEAQSDALATALNVLPEAQREIILLAAWEELNPREIAIVTGVPVNLVRVRLHRARNRLKKELATASAEASTRNPAPLHRLSRGPVG